MPPKSTLSLLLDQKPQDLSQEANFARWAAAHPDGSVLAEGTDNNGRLPPIDGNVYPEDVERETLWCLDILHG